MTQPDVRSRESVPTPPPVPITDTITFVNGKPTPEAAHVYGGAPLALRNDRESPAVTLHFERPAPFEPPHNRKVITIKEGATLVVTVITPAPFSDRAPYYYKSKTPHHQPPGDPCVVVAPPPE